MTAPGNDAPSAPLPLSDRHDLSAFDCEEASLNDWLRRRALANQVSGGSRTFVVCAGPARVVGYYSLSAFTVTHSQATGSIRRNMPDPVPIMLIGRLAVDRDSKGLGLGSAMLKDAILRVAQVAEQAGVRGIVVHAISEDAKRFYMRWGFVESPVDPMTLMIRLSDIVATVRSVA